VVIRIFRNHLEPMLLEIEQHFNNCVLEY